MSFKNLNLNLLRVFDAVMTERNLTRAGNYLEMSQSAVSHAIQHLRDALGDQIVVRTAYGVRATTRAEQIWPYIRKALATLEGAISPESFNPLQGETTFRLAMADSTAVLFLPPLIRLLERDAPRINVRMFPLITRDPRPMLYRSDIDIAIGSFPGVLQQLAGDQGPTSPPIRHHRLYTGNYVCVMRKHHPLAQAELTLDAYCNAVHLQVSFSGRSNGLVDDALEKLNRRRKTLLTVTQYFAAGNIIANSNLITVLPFDLIALTGIAHELIWRALPFKLPDVNVDMLWHERDAQRAAHKWLRDFLLTLPQIEVASNGRAEMGTVPLTT